LVNDGQGFRFLGGGKRGWGWSRVVEAVGAGAFVVFFFGAIPYHADLIFGMVAAGLAARPARVVGEEVVSDGFDALGAFEAVPIFLCWLVGEVCCDEACDLRSGWLDNINIVQFNLGDIMGITNGVILRTY
jgi:hypothetical protein